MGTLTDAAGAPLSAYSYRVSGPLAGLFAGANYQWNRIVVGAEADWQWSSLTGTIKCLRRSGTPGAFPTGPFTVSTTATGR